MKTHDCDLLIIGGGLGGLAAAVRARALGLRVVILEKSEFLGGVAAYSGGIVWLGNNHLAAREGIADSEEETKLYLDFLNGEDPNYDRDLREALYRGGIEAIRYYTEEIGIPFSVIGRPDQYYPDAPGSKARGRSLEVALPGRQLGNWRPRLRPSPIFKVGLTRKEINENGGKEAAYKKLDALYRKRVAEDFLTSGQGLAGAFLKAAVIEWQADVHFNVETSRLLMENGRVCGAQALVEGEEIMFRASRGVLLATGSYGYHKDVARMEGLPSIREQAPPIIHGDGMRLAEGTGAAVTRAGITFTTLGFPLAGETHPGTTQPLYIPIHASAGFPHAIIVNATGRRFGDESFYGYLIDAIQAFDGRSKRFTNYPPFFVMDDGYRRRYTLAELDRWPEGDLVRAETLDELAEVLGIDRDGLQAEVEKFNRFVDQGIDEDFRRGASHFANHAYGDKTYRNPTLGRIETPPFWGVRLEIVGAGIYSMGLPIDTHARVLNRSGEPVPGLYASGNTVAYTEILHGYEGGLANIRSITYAWLAATHAAGAQPG